MKDSGKKRIKKLKEEELDWQNSTHRQPAKRALHMNLEKLFKHLGLQILNK